MSSFRVCISQVVEFSFFLCVRQPLKCNLIISFCYNRWVAWNWTWYEVTDVSSFVSLPFWQWHFLISTTHKFTFQRIIFCQLWLSVRIVDIAIKLVCICVRFFTLQWFLFLSVESQRYFSIRQDYFSDECWWANIEAQDKWGDIIKGMTVNQPFQ